MASRPTGAASTSTSSLFATGFDAMTGAIRAVHPITGARRQITGGCLANGPQTYLGLTIADFQSVSDHGSRQPVSAVEHGGSRSSSMSTGWSTVSSPFREDGFHTIEPTETAQAGWARHMQTARP